MKSFLSFFIFLILGMLLLACNEDKDQLPPEISIDQPIENSVYSVKEAIPVEAELHDNKIIENVEVSLYSQNDNRKVGNTIARGVGTDNYFLDFAYTIEDSLLPSGAYYIRIHAYDGNNIGYAFREINILGLEKKQLHMLLITSDNNTSSILEMKEDNSLSIRKTFNFTYMGAGLQQQQKLLYLADSENSDLLGVDIKNYSLRWTKSYPATASDPAINFLSMVKDNSKAAVSIQNGYVEILSSEGTLVKTFQTQTGMFPHKHFVEQDLTFIESYSNNRNVHQLEIFFTSTSGQYDNKSIDFEMVDIFASKEGKYDLFVNEDGKGKLKEYSSNGRGISSRDVLANDSIVEVIKVNQNEFLLAAGSTIYKYIKSTGSSLPFIQGKKVDAMAFDPLSKEVYVAVSNQFYTYDYDSGNLKSNFSTTAAIKEIFPVYNY